MARSTKRVVSLLGRAVCLGETLRQARFKWRSGGSAMQVSPSHTTKSSCRFPSKALQFWLSLVKRSYTTFFTKKKHIFPFCYFIINEDIIFYISSFNINRFTWPLLRPQSLKVKSFSHWCCKKCRPTGYRAWAETADTLAAVFFNFLQ